ncbi:DUF1990 family protein [Saccharomonospora iraqiensis]|uniref:DUF1990 family protein n=1 Tax=Saccharomonospora iraqiensis TaxID=52698 RepID=UPI00041ACB6E|nr:DUF1990 family protein [Saccharomonospora iraqiensis]
MSRARRVLVVLARWLLGTALVTWRYLWETTPLHRTECRGDARDLPPRLPDGLIDDRVQRSADGYGQLFHRRFRVRIAGAGVDAAGLMDRVVHDFKHFVPSEVVHIHTTRGGARSLCAGDELVVEMPGPWDGPVRVVHRDDTSLHLVTLHGHLEAGQVWFRAFGDGDQLVFEVELWAAPASRLVHLLYARLRLAKEIQLNMWVRFCLAAVETSGGRLVDGVEIFTHRLDDLGERTGPAGLVTDGDPVGDRR